MILTAIIFETYICNTLIQLIIAHNRVGKDTKYFENFESLPSHTTLRTDRVQGGSTS